MAQSEDDNLDEDFLSGEVEVGSIDFEGDDRTEIQELEDDDADDIGEEGEEKDDEEGAEEDLGAETEEVEQPGEEAATEDNTNEWFLAAQLWQEQGRLSPDFQLDPNMTQLDLEDLRIKQVDADVYNRIQTKISDKLVANGIDPNKIFNEQSQEEFLQGQYATIASLTYDMLLEKSPDVTKSLMAIGTEYWIAKSEGKFEPDDVAPNVAKDLDSHTEEELLTKYQAFFREESKRLETKIKTEADLASKAEADRVRNESIYIKQKLASGQIGGKKYTPEQILKVINGLHKEDQIYDDGKGGRRVVSLFEKKRLEKSSTIDKQLEYAVALILEEEDQTPSKEKERLIGGVNTMQKLASATLMNPGANKKKKTTTKSSELVEGDDFLD